MTCVANAQWGSDQESWETVRDAAFTDSVGSRLTIGSLFGPGDDEAPGIPLAGPGRYLVRAYVRRCREASGRGEAEFFHDVEQWLVQVWPATGPGEGAGGG